MPILRLVKASWPAYVLIAIILSTMFCSCVSTRDLIYMQGKFDTAKLSQIITREDVIQKGDVLSIIIYSDNPEATKIYNQPVITTGGASGAGDVSGASGIAGSAPSAGGYLVDESGNIEFQGLGLIHVDSL